MGEKMNREYFESGATAFNYNNVTGGGDSASGGSGGSGMECLQLRSPPGPFHYLISEQAKSLVALQELQNEVGALLEFRDLVIETFPNLRSRMAPSTPGGGARREWEPGVRVRRKLAAAGDPARAKPQPSVQDSGFSTETSCGKAARPLEDELWALLDVIQRKGLRLRDEADLLRGELAEPEPPAEESFARALAGEAGAGGARCADCALLPRLRAERDALLARAARLEADAAAAAAPASPARSPAPAPAPLGRLDRALATPTRPPTVASPDSTKFAAILQESNPVELQRQLLTSTVQNQALCEKLKRAAAQRTVLLQRLEQARDSNDDLRFRLEEKNIELEGARARVRQLESRARASSADSLERRSHCSMREMEPLRLGDERERSGSRRAPERPSRIPLHTRPRAPPPPPRPPSAHSVRSARSSASARSRAATPAAAAPPPAPKSGVPVRRSPAHDNKRAAGAAGASWGGAAGAGRLVEEYVARTGRLVPLVRPLPPELLADCRLAYESPQNLALELYHSILYSRASITPAVDNLGSLHPDSLWNGKPQQYFESMNYAQSDDVDKTYDADSLAP